VTRVTIAPKEGGPNDSLSIHSQSGMLKNRSFSGSGSDTDIMTSSARAYVSALNKLLTWNARRLEQASRLESGGEPELKSVAAEPMQVAESSP
jgi:2-isopropylmalate synthase